MLSFATNETHVSVSGPATFHIKEVLKNFSGRWSPDSRSWAVPIKHDNESFRANLLETAKEAKRLERETKKVELEAKRAYDLSPEGIAKKKAEYREVIKKCLEEKATTGRYHWICCQECHVIDWVRQITSCDACADDHGRFKNTMCVRGVRYTGD
jgi:hypothetical protein